MNDLVIRNGTSVATVGTQDFVTVILDGQQVGIPVLEVHDVLNAQKITIIPRAPDWVAGVLNLRGRIVTAIDLRRRLGLPPLEAGKSSMSVVVEHNEEPYSLQIDKVGEVLSIEDQLFEKNPITLDSRWREVSIGVYRLKDQLLPILNVDRLLALDSNSKAA